MPHLNGKAKPTTGGLAAHLAASGSRYATASPAVPGSIPVPSPLPSPSKIVAELLTDAAALGIVGEENLVIGVYLVGTSRLLDRPLALIAQGSSSSGKTSTVNGVAQFFPDDQVIHATRMTPQALYHMPEAIAHKFVVGGERSRIQDDAATDATAALRQLISERRIVKQIVEREGDKFVTRQLVIEGPIAFVQTTTLTCQEILKEDRNRCILLQTDETEKQTRAILNRRAAEYTSGKQADTKAIIKRHHDFQSGLQALPVTIPFAAELLEKLPAKKVEARRVAGQVLSMIEASCLLHQAERQQDSQGRLIATLVDYGIAARVLKGPVDDALGAGAGAMAMLKKLAEKFGQREFTSHDAQQADKEVSERSVSGWLKSLWQADLIDQVNPSKGRNPATWKLTGKSAEGILPLLVGKPAMPAD